jgi:hypothetical protein
VLSNVETAKFGEHTALSKAEEGLVTCLLKLNKAGYGLKYKETELRTLVQRFVFANNINPIFNSEVQKVGKYR